MKFCMGFCDCMFTAFMLIGARLSNILYPALGISVVSYIEKSIDGSEKDGLCMTIGSW